ncbi:unnamed protein product [marine sediment metagenome]|uniref:Uncharacterized protein n=1 Tax=marine sediment metagenome TaxID=412755 RepID=X1GZ22_9ZZZZ
MPIDECPSCGKGILIVCPNCDYVLCSHCGKGKKEREEENKRYLEGRKVSEYEDCEGDDKYNHDEFVKYNDRCAKVFKKRRQRTYTIG